MRFAYWAVAFVTAFALMPFALAQNQPPTAPDWLLQLPKTDAQRYRALATGADVQQARTLALADIAGQVAVTISSASRSHLQKQRSGVADAQTQNHFQLSVDGQNVPLQFSNVDTEKQYLHGNGEVTVLLSVDKQDIANYLKNQLHRYQGLQFPAQQNAQQQLLWLLRYKQPLQRANAYALAYQQLTQTKADEHAKQQLAAVTAAEQSLGLRIVGSRDLDDISAAIARQAPAHSQPSLWLQLQQTHQQRKQGTRYQHRTQLLAAVTEPSSPFRELHRQQLQVVGEGPTAAAAAHDAHNKLTEKVTQPLSQWLFDGKNN